MTLSKPVLEWLKAQVRAGKEASIGWVIDRIAYEKMQRAGNEPVDPNGLPLMTEAQQQELFDEMERRMVKLLCVRRIRHRETKKKKVEA